MPNLKSTLKVFNVASLTGKPGAHPQQISKRLAGGDDHPSERLYVGLTTFEPGAHAPLHWHIVEGLYYVISGSAVLTDIEGKSHDIGPGSVIYTPAGIDASHQWDIKDSLQLIAIRATTDPVKLIQFGVDKSTNESSIELDRLIRHEACSFKSFY